MLAMDRPDEALDHFNDGLSIQEPLLESNPKNPSYRLYQRNLQFNSGRAHLAVRDYEDAVEMGDAVLRTLPSESSQQMATELFNRAARQVSRDEGLEPEERRSLAAQYRAKAKGVVDQLP